MDMKHKAGRRYFYVRATERRAIELVKSVMDDLKKFEVEFTFDELASKALSGVWFTKDEEPVIQKAVAPVEAPRAAPAPVTAGSESTMF